MEYLKKALSSCCKDCCFKRKDSASSTQIIIPTTRKVSTKQGNLVSRSTFDYLPQPDFYIPFSEDKITTRVSPTTRRKQSAPPVMTRTIAIQPISAYTSREMHKSWGEPQIHIEEHTDDDNINNNSLTLDASSRWKSTESINSTQSSLSPTHKPASAVRRLSVAQIAANHSRRSSMVNFDICKDDVDSEMYASGDLTQDMNSNGKLCFTLSYNDVNEQLTVHVIEAKNLYNSEHSLPVTDSYVAISLLSGLKRKSTKTNIAIHRGTSNPTYDESVKFDHVPVDGLDTLSIKLSVYSADRSCKRKKVGTVVYQLDKRVLMSEKDSSEHIWRHIYSEGLTPTAGDRGSIMLSTCYQPTDSQLKIYVSKGTELAITDHERSYEGVYVKIALVGQGKVISKEKTKLIHPATSNPVFDEMLTFTLPSNMIDQACLIVSVNAKTSHGKRFHIGYVSLGPPFFAAGSGLEQWTKMLSVPFTMVSKWHSLTLWSKKDSSHKLNECNMF